MNVSITPTPSPVLVIAIAGRIGSGTSFVRDRVEHALSKYAYEVVPIDVSRVILERTFSKLFEDAEKLADKSPTDRIQELQVRGTRLRREFSADIVARLIVSTVIALNLEDPSKRKAYLIDSLKHPDEVDYLRSVFGNAFYLVGVVATDGRRRQRLRERKGLDAEAFETLSRIDARESGTEEGQRTIDTVVQADYFFANNYHTVDGIEKEANRFVRLIFGTRVDTPRLDEKGMSAAFIASNGSACLSRQVGAALFDASGEPMVTGCNDVPRFGGGLYSADSISDKRCWCFGAKCYNDEEKSLILDEIRNHAATSLSKALGCLPEEISQQITESSLREEFLENFSSALNHSRVKDLIEFSRAVHAEMDAIVSAARVGRGALQGSTMYCTTYPCHNCAKHLIASGVARVVYLEPYEKSLARRLHPDAIADPMAEEPEANKLRLDLYSGAAPWRFDEFFKKDRQRKRDGRYIDRDRHPSKYNPRGAIEVDVLRSRLEAATAAPLNEPRGPSNAV